MKVGTIVRATRSSAINRAGELGVVYQDYGNGCGIIFESGEYDGFSDEDIVIFGVVPVGFASEVAGYQFTSVMRLSNDFANGVFAAAFKGAE